MTRKSHREFWEVQADHRYCSLDAQIFAVSATD